ncbi:hypothetical protein AAKU55_002911 [Oxalobacteraceae bacterium GrIS 1.11]
MATQQRIDNLTQFCEQWENRMQDAGKRRDELLFWQANGLSVSENSDDGENLLPTLIAEADRATLQYQKILVKMKSLRDRAIAGEDV